jgi:enoyl-CoA hydratase
MFRDLLVERRGDVDIVTLNRPEVLNALTRRTYDELEQAVRESTARCIVITGMDPAFCAGDDIGEFMGSEGLTTFLREEAKLTTCTEAFLFTDRPIVAAVNGIAVGWGMELALLADVRIASERSRFGEAFVLRGLCSDVAGVGRLSQLVGREQATRLLLTGEVIDARRAANIGLVSEVVGHDQVLSRALEVADAIARNPPLAVQRLKAALRAATDPEWHGLGTTVRRWQAELSETEDHRESVQAFLEKRPPCYVGR